MRVLYHFTCHHGHEGISKTGVLLPHVNYLMPHLGPLLWLTDLAEPTVDALGLTSHVLLTCDRLAYRYCVQTKATHWAQVRGRVSPAILDVMERYSNTDRWWVARRPLTPSEFTFDRCWSGPCPASPSEKGAVR